jgi:hypothetical protein
MKQYYIRYNVGKCKYIVRTNDGTKFYKDGSELWDIEIFSNKRKMEVYIAELKLRGYTYY